MLPSCPILWSRNEARMPTPFRNILRWRTPFRMVLAQRLHGRKQEAPSPIELRTDSVRCCEVRTVKKRRSLPLRSRCDAHVHDSRRSGHDEGERSQDSPLSNRRLRSDMPNSSPNRPHPPPPPLSSPPSTGQEPTKSNSSYIKMYAYFYSTEGENSRLNVFGPLHGRIKHFSSRRALLIREFLKWPFFRVCQPTGWTGLVVAWGVVRSLVDLPGAGPVGRCPWWQMPTFAGPVRDWYCSLCR